MKVVENYASAAYALQGRCLLGALQGTQLIPWLEDQRALPNGWRAIVTVQVQDGDEMKTCEHLDIQSDKGGGSWAPAKHQALYAGADYTKVIPMEEIQGIIKERGLEETELGVAILEKEYFEQLSKAEQNWIVDVENGLGIAPNYGGIKVPYTVVAFSEADEFKMVNGLISVAFSGGEAWQDVRYALYVLQEVVAYLESDCRVDDIEVCYDILAEDTTIETWLDEMGLLRDDECAGCECCCGEICIECCGCEDDENEDDESECECSKHEEAGGWLV